MYLVERKTERNIFQLDYRLDEVSVKKKKKRHCKTVTFQNTVTSRLLPSILEADQFSNFGASAGTEKQNATCKEKCILISLLYNIPQHLT